MKILQGAHLAYRLGYLALTVLLLAVNGMAAQEAVAATEKEGGLMVENERALRKALTESLQAEVASICKEMFCEPPSVSVTADLSEVVGAFPEKLATSPTVRCHRVPCIAITSDNWRHLMDVYAKSDEGVRRIALEVGLSRQEDAMTLTSASVKSTEDFARPKTFRAKN